LPLARVEAHADGPAGDDELLGAAVRREPLAQPLDIQSGNEEVGVLRLVTEQLVADRTADEVGVEPEPVDVVLDPLQHLSILAAAANSQLSQRCLTPYGGSAGSRRFGPARTDESTSARRSVCERDRLD